MRKTVDTLAPFVVLESKQEFAGAFNHVMLDIYQDWRYTAQHKVVSACALIVNTEDDNGLVDLGEGLTLLPEGSSVPI